MSEADYQDALSTYAAYLSDVGRRGFENVVPSRQSFLNDPLTFAGYLRQRPVLMVQALWDEVIPREAAVEFWRACGQPEIAWYLATHASVWLWYPLIRRRISRVLGSAFSV